jgi:transcription termination/antitermination protein NusG
VTLSLRAESDPLERWHVLHTKSRQEKALASALSAMGCAYYLPLVERARYFGRRKARVEVPLFPGYLFLWGTFDQAYEADRTKRVAQVITVADQTTLEWEIRNIRLALARKAPLSPHPYLQKGVRVEVRCGPFRGLQGVVESRRGRDRLILQVDAFGRAVSLEIEESLLDRID